MKEKEEEYNFIGYRVRWIVCKNKRCRRPRHRERKCMCGNRPE